LTGLLRADAQTVRFFGRRRDLDQLRTWCDSSAERSAWLVTGPGGQGKTRLALQLSQTLAGTARWAATMVRGCLQRDRDEHEAAPEGYPKRLPPKAV
jgi:hypothetical protein